MKKIFSFILLSAVGTFLFTGCDKIKEISKNNPLKKMIYPKQAGMSINNLKQIGLGLEFYSQSSKDYSRPNGTLRNGADPLNDPAAAFDILVQEGFLTDTKVYVAPYDKKSKPAEYGATLTIDNTSYVYILPTPKPNYINNHPSSTPVVFEKPWILPGDKINVLYADGHVETVDIPGVSEMSCREVLTILLSETDIPADVQEKMLKYADTADRNY